MKFAPYRLVALALVLFAGTAGAQLKPPRNAPAPAVPGAPATPAPAAAAVDNTEKEAAGKLAAAGWLVLLDRGDWGRAWETSSSVFRKTVPLPSWMDAIPKVREPFGALIERTPAESVYKTTLQGQPNGEYVTSIFLSKFDKRELQEVVTTVRDTDGKWRVTGYSPR
ncbi:MAG TPA: DUF4019 domain-containing protein [Ramlibacter sp.]|nr:DUF4019 domain-containing protein [Ramlibacter sp.]